ncbi:hypothetical protein EC991_010707 [Linnemannia zychae]|nr:hypothetical protein EC991_010707 [Linnemannia zychae]
MTPLTTTDDDSSTIASTHLHQHPRIPRSRQVSKNGSLTSSLTSPSSTYPHSDLSNQLNTLSLQNDAPIYPQHHRQSSSTYRGDDGKDSKMETGSIRSTKSGAVSVSASTIASTVMTSPSAGNGDQLRVRHLEPGASYTGYLTKFSSRTFFSRKQWKRRYFVLNQRSLYCFKSSDPQHPLLETLNLCAETIVCVTDIFAGKRYCLQITSPGEKNWYVLADTANELSGWLRHLKGTVLRCRNPQQAMDQDPLYQYHQQHLESSRPRTHYSDSSEWSDLSSAASYGLMDNGMHSSSVPPFTNSNNNHASSYLSNLSRSSSPSSTPPRRLPHPSERLDPYLMTPVGGNPHPRPMTPSFSPATGPESMLVQEQGLRKHDDHRHYNVSNNNAHDGNDDSRNSISPGHLSSDYASFGAVMERAEAVSPETNTQGQTSSGEGMERTRFLSFPQESSLTPQHPLSLQQQQQHSPQKKKQQKRDSSLTDFSSDLDLFTHTEGGAIAARRGSSSSSTFSGNGNGGRRVSVVIDRPEAMITLPRRSSQRLMGSPSRPMSPVLSRPMSPNSNRPSPRSSLVVAPPPRSIHRPTSVSVRHSTQMISSLQIATQNLQQSIKTAEQHQRPMSPLDSPQRPGSRLSHLRYPSNVGLIHDRSTNGLGLGRVSMDRPLSPTPATLASPPTSPLPEPPRPGSISPVRALRHSLSNSSSSSHRISIVPRHHDPDLLVSHRANPRSRAQSQESALVSRSQDKHFGQQPQPQLQHISHRASSPLPAFPSAIALTEIGTDLDHNDQDAVLKKHISLPANNKMALPPLPKGQQPDTASHHHSLHHHQYQHNTFPRQHKHSLSNASVSSMSSQTSSTHSFPAGVASFGGAVARKNNGRDSTLSVRLSTLVPIPVGSVSSVPLPPQTALPPIPGTVVPSSPASPLPTPPTSGKVEVIVPASADNEDSIAALLAVPLSNLPTPPTSLSLALPAQLAGVQEEEQQPCMTATTTPVQDIENSVIDRQEDTVGVQSKVEPLSEGIVTPDTVVIEEEKPHSLSSEVFEMILEESEEADVSLISVQDIVSITATTATATTTTTITNTAPTKDQLEEQEEKQEEDVVASLAIKPASPSLSS